MTEQPAEAPNDEPRIVDGRDTATPEQRLARAHKSNDLANALITLRDDLPAAAIHLQDVINTDVADTGYLDPVESVRMLANVVLTLTNRIANYAHDLDRRTGDPSYFTDKHARVVLLQMANPIVRSINNPEPK